MVKGTKITIFKFFMIWRLKNPKITKIVIDIAF